MRKKINALGALGLNTDVHPTLLPENVWTRMYNAQTADGSLRSVPGERKLFDFAIKPLYHTSFVDMGIQRLVVSDGAKVRSYNMAGLSEDITPSTGDLSGGRVTFTDLNGVLVINSYTDGPFFWAGNSSLLEALPGWDASWVCREMKAFRYYLVALGMTENGIEFPHKIRWSTSAEEGAIPNDWTPAITNDAGDDLLGETAGKIVTGIIKRDTLAIIKEDAIYSMSWIGGNNVMQTQRLKGGVGTRIPLGTVEMRGHVVTLTTSDLLSFDGQTSVSLSDKRVREGIFATISPDYWEKSVLFIHYPSSQLFVGGVSSGYDRLSAALVYDWEENTWSQRQLSYGYGFDEAIVSFSTNRVPWDDLDEAGSSMGGIPPGKIWDEQRDGPWNRGLYNPSITDILVYESNSLDTEWWVSVVAVGTTDSAGKPKTCSAERVGFPLGGTDELQMVTEVWPEIVGDIPVTLQFGYQMTDNDSPKWGKKFTVTPGLTRSITPRVTGRYLAYRVESAAEGRWELASMTMNLENAGER